MLNKNWLVAGAMMLVASASFAQNCGGRGEYSCSSAEHRQAQHQSQYQNSAGYRATYDANQRDAAANAARHGESNAGGYSVYSSNPAVNNSGRYSGKGSASASRQ